MSFEIVLKWQHTILIIGFISGLLLMFKNYEARNDSYGIEGLFRFGAMILCFMFFLCIYFGLGYFGVFK